MEGDLANATRESGTYPYPNNTISTAKLLNGVEKSHGAGGFILGDFSKVVNENGEPKVVYHGSRTIRPFTAFDTEGGAFFSDNAEVAQLFGKDGGNFYLDVDGKRFPLDERGARDLASISEVEGEENYIQLDEPLVIKGNWTEGWLNDDSAEAWKEVMSYNTGLDEDVFDGATDISVKRVDRRDITEAGVYPVFLNIRNPRVRDWEGRGWTTEESIEGELFAGGRDTDGIDGGIAENIVEGGPISEEDFPVSNVYVVFKPGQIKSAIANNGEFDGENGDIRFRLGDRRVSGGGFFSTVENALAGIRQEKGTPEQFKAMLLKGGAAQAEMDWLGWDEFASGRKSVTKAEVQVWVEENGIVLGENMLGGREYYGEQIDKLVDIKREFNLNQQEIHNIERKSLDTSSERFSAKLRELKNRQDEILQTYGSIEQLDEEIGRLAELKNKHQHTKYGEYKVRGGRDYRELLLTLPTRKPGNIEEIKRLETTEAYLLEEIKRLEERLETEHGNNGERDALRAQINSMWEGLNRVINHIRWLREMPNGMEYESSHWRGTPNVVAHVRYDTRKTADGADVLFVEEIQSDWAQERRRSDERRRMPFERWTEARTPFESNLEIARTPRNALREGDRGADAL
jgi:hypothetical protein